MRKYSSILIGALVVCLSGILLLPLVASATTWNSPYTLGAGGTKPSVAIDSQGNFHYIWWEPTAKVIQYTVCTGLNKNSCAAVETLPDNGNDSYYPNIAVGPDDEPSAVWESKDGNSYSIYWSHRTAGTWGAAKKISTEAYSELPDIAVGPQNINHVTYQSKQGDSGFVYYVESDDGFATLRKTELDSRTSDQPITVAAEMAHDNAAEGQQLANGFNPRVAADADDHAHVVWNAPSPYGIYYRIQLPTGGFDDKITVSTGKKDQTADIGISPTGSAAIIWSTYDNFNIALAEYINGNPDLKKYDVDGGTEQSLWPRIAVDCLGIFHYAFQGKATAANNWNVYHRTYNSSNNKFTKRETIGDSNANEQTPSLAVNERGAVVYADTTGERTKGSTADLGLNCSGSATDTPTSTATQTLTPTATTTGTPPSPTQTLTASLTPTVTETSPNSPTPTNTATDTPTLTPTVTVTSQSGTEHVPSNDPRIVYTGTWKQIQNKHATDDSYARCGGKKRCRKNWTAQLDFTGGARVEWETAYANTYGKAEVFLDGALFERIDLCKLRRNSALPRFAKRTYVLSGDSSASHSIMIRAMGEHSNCSAYNANFVTVDGFNILR